MDQEVDPVYEAEQAFEQAERFVRHVASELELAEAKLTIARLEYARAKEAERESRGW